MIVIPFDMATLKFIDMPGVGRQMANTIIKTGLLSLLGACAVVTSVQAGGFSRGEADTDILFEEGRVVVRGGVTYVSPKREFETTGGLANDDGAYSQDYFIPGFAAKFGISDNLACAFTYTQPFGADVEYGADAQLAAALNGNTPYGEKGFETNEYAATCDVKFALEKGTIHFLGGGFVQDFKYTAVNEADNFGGANYGTLTLEDDAALGYRIGAAYEIPEYALRAQIMYRSQVDHDADKGNYDFMDLGTILFPATGYGSLPQSVKLSLQSGVAPGWLVYGSAKWTDWSVLEALNYEINGTPLQDIYNWKDGWTLQAGVAHVFTEKVSGTINITWDQGVGNGADIMTDTWTVATGAAIKAGPGELRVGGAVSYLTSGSQNVTDGASYNATADGDWAYALSASYKIAF